MKFVCEKCHTKYSIADDKVRRKVLKIRCKTCGNVIEVREAGSGSGGAAGGGTEEFSETSTRVDHGATAAAAAAAEMARSKGPPPKPVGAFGRPARESAARAAPEASDWHMALEGKEQGPFTRTELVRRLAAYKPDDDVHVWHEDLDGWKSPSAIPDLDRDVKAARLRSSKPSGSGLSKPPMPPMPPPTRGPSVPPAPSLPRGALSAAGAAAAVGVAAAPPLARTMMGASVAPAVAPPSLTGPRSQIAGGPPPGAPRSPATGKHAVAALTGRAQIASIDEGAPTPAPVFPAESRPKGLSPFPIEDMTGPPILATRPQAPARMRSLPVDPETGADLAPAPVAVAGAPVPPSMASHSSVSVTRSRVVGMKYAIAGLVVVVLLLAIIVVYLGTQPAAPAPAASGAPSSGSSATGAPKRISPEELAQKMGAGDPVGGDIPSQAATAVSPTAATRTVAVIGPRGSKRAGGRAAGSAAKVTAAQPAATRRFADGPAPAPPPGASAGPRGPASPEAIKAVFKGNQASIKSCYDRALMRDRTLTHGRIDVTAVVGVSGRAKSVQVKTSSEFRIMEPCVKDVVSHWAFPASSEEYDASFPYIFQGG